MEDPLTMNVTRELLFCQRNGETDRSRDRLILSKNNR
jgi:hypothetical protein